MAAKPFGGEGHDDSDTSWCGHYVARWKDRISLTLSFKDRIDPSPCDRPALGAGEQAQMWSHPGRHRVKSEDRH